MKRFLWLPALTLAGCASPPPDWIMKPAIEGGFAATECVQDSGNLSSDRQAAVAKARAEIGRQLERRVVAMDKTYAQMTEERSRTAGAEQPARPGSVEAAFESVSKQIAEQTLSDLAPSRVEYIELDDQRSLCAMVTVDRAQARAVYDRIVQASGRQLDPEANETLYKEYSGAGS